MQQYLAEGLAAAEAAALASGPPAPAAPSESFAPAVARRELADALGAFDESRAQATLDRLFAAATVDAALTDVVLPYLRELGDSWERGEVSVAQEHFASNVIRGRLLGLARGWGRGVGPLALLACLPGEHHELGLIAFGLALRSHGWRIAYLGADTPLDTLEGAARALEPRLVVLSAATPDRVRDVAPRLRQLAKRYPLALGGSAAAGSDAARLGVLELASDPVAEAAQVAALIDTA
jgi:methanogenic corrinoid protein MtbC1